MGLDGRQDFALVRLSRLIALEKDIGAFGSPERPLLGGGRATQGRASHQSPAEELSSFHQNLLFLKNKVYASQDNCRKALHKERTGNAGLRPRPPRTFQRPCRLAYSWRQLPRTAGTPSVLRLKAPLPVPIMRRLDFHGRRRTSRSARAL